MGTGYRYRGRHRAPSATRRNTAAVVTAGAAVVLPVLAPTAASAAEGVNWAPIIACESGGNPTAQNPNSTASGLLQFLDSSWIAYGGGKYAARAKDATVAQQMEIANVAYARSGLAPWAASKPCWAGKVGTVAKPVVPKTTPKVEKAPKVHTEVVPDAKPGKASWADAAGVYTVHSGDTLSGIAFRHGKPSWRDLYERNRQVVGSNPNLILPGQQLQL